MRRLPLRLGVHYHFPVFEENGRLKTHGPYARFLSALASCVSELTVFGFSPSTKGMLSLYSPDTFVEADNCQLVNLGIRQSLFTCYFRYGRFLPLVKPVFGSIDAMLVRAPTPLSGLFLDCFTGPRGAYIIGDYLRGITTSLPPGFKLAAAMALNYAYTVRLKRQLKDIPVAVNSSFLASLWRKRGITAEIPVLPSGTLLASEHHGCDERFRKKPYRALLVGRVYRSKGIAEAAAALGRCRNGDFIFDIVGPIEDAGFAEAVRIANPSLDIRFHDTIPLGDRLWEFYRKADLFLLPFTGAEGFPRVLWEAAAFSVPIITSNNESIRTFLTNGENCLLADPRDIDQLAGAIQRLRDDSEFRKRLIRNARSLAAGATVERRTEELIRHFHQRWNLIPGEHSRR